MATAIHHGPPGSFKTFTLVQRHAINALKKGRVVVCNIRGFDSIDNVINAFPEAIFPDSARIISVDTTTEHGRRKMACWFHWIPFGALVIIDEAQQIYPDRRDFKLESLDKYIHDEPLEYFESADPRPYDVFVAYDKQRHFNWDIFLSTTNIAKVKRDIREVSDVAYRHRNLSGLLPWWRNKWREFEHDPETSGKSASHYIGSPKDYTADERIFRCYSSTATGLHSTTKTRDAIYKDPKLIGLAILITVCFFIGTYSFFFVKPQVDESKDSKANPSSLPAPAMSNVATSNDVGKPSAKSADGQLEKPKKKLFDIEDIRKYAINDVKPEEVNNFPDVCTFDRKKITCTLRATPEVLRNTTNRLCDNFKCTVYFFIKYPPKNQQPEYQNALTNSSILSKL